MLGWKFIHVSKSVYGIVLCRTILWILENDNILGNWANAHNKIGNNKVGSHTYQYNETCL